MSRHSVPASDVSGLLRRFAELKRKAAARTGRDFPIIVIQEAGLDGFWTVCELDLVQHAIRSWKTGSDLGSQTTAGALPMNP
jgi:hypothetical protein